MTRFFHALILCFSIVWSGQAQTLTATSTGPTSFSVSWTQPTGVFVGYRIGYRLGNSGAFTYRPLISNPATLTTTVSDPSFTPGNGYQFQLETYTGTTGSEVFTVRTFGLGFTPPTAPSSATATQVRQTTDVQVTWTDNSTNESGFQLEYDINSSGSFIRFSPNLAVDATSQTITTLAPDQAYRFRIRSFVINTTVTPRDTIYSGYSNISSTVNLVGRPTAPEGIIGRQSPGTNFLIFDWTDRSNNENGFQVQLSDNNGSSFFFSRFYPPKNPGDIVTTSEIGGLATAATYVARVRAFRVNNNLSPADTLFSDFSALSGPVFNHPRLEGPKNLRFNYLDNFDRIELVWDDIDLYEHKYEIEVSLTGAPDSFRKVVTDVPGNSGPIGRFVLTGLLEAQGYWIRMISANTAGYSPLSNTINLATLPSRPLAPSNLRVVDSTLNAIILSWVDNAKNEDNFVLERSFDNQNWVPLQTLPLNSTTFTDLSLTNGTKYFYRLRARNAGGFSPYTPVLEAMTRRLVAPNPATNLKAEVLSDTEVKLTWKNSPFQDFTYRTNTRLRNRVIGFIPGIKDVDMVIDKDAEEVIVRGLRPNFEYSFQIYAENDGGQGKSAFVYVTMFGPPAAPENFSFSRISNALGENYLSFRWQDRSTNEEMFIITMGTQASDMQELARVLPDTTRFFHFPQDEGRTLFYSVFAQNKWGRSTSTLPIRVDIPYTLAPQAPYGLKGVVKAEGIALSWLDNSIREESFEVFRSSNNGTSFERIGVLPRNTNEYLDAGITTGVTYLYRVRAINPLGASAFTSTITIANVQVRGQLPTELATVFPNPTADWVEIRAENGLNLSKSRVLITQETGKVWMSNEIPEGSDTYRLDIRRLPAGLYSLVIQSAQGNITKKIVKY